MEYPASALPSKTDPQLLELPLQILNHLIHLSLQIDDPTREGVLLGVVGLRNWQPPLSLLPLDHLDVLLLDILVVRRVAQSNLEGLKS